MSLIQKLTPRITYQWGPSPNLGWTRSAPWDKKKMVIECLPNMVRFMTTGRDCEMKISPAISINKKCHSHQWFLATKCEWGLPKLIQPMLPPSTVIAEELGGMQEAANCHSLRWTRKQDCPGSWGAYERNESSEPRDLHLPIHRS